MNDLLLGACWIGVLLSGLGIVALLRHLGLPRTYARDLLHVGAGIWIVGWPWWDEWKVPAAIAGVIFAGVAVLPFGLSRALILQRLHDSVAGEGERWSGIVAYAGSFAAMTVLALGAKQPAPAACATAALCLGDGIGGLIGRRFGKHRFAVPWSKAKTWEGTAAVAVFSAVGILLACAALSLPVRAGPVALLALVSATAEALAPRAWDNAWVPAAVFAAALLVL